MRKELLTAIFLISVSFLFAQTKKTIAQLQQSAEESLDDRQYQKAFDYYVQLQELDPKNNLEYELRRGIAATFIPSKKKEAIEILENLRNRDSSDITLLLYLGEAYHHNYNFDKAMDLMSRFLNLNTDPEEEEKAKLFLLHAQNGKRIVNKPVEVEIQNLGRPVNSADAEYVPVVSTDNSMLIFTYRGTKSTGGLMDAKFNPDTQGEYYEDIYYSVRQGEAWKEPLSIGENINTKHNDAAIALSPDKNQLFTFYSSQKDGGDIYVCKRDGDTWDSPVPLGSNVNTSAWEGSCSLSGDGKNLYFASEREGGYGGKDIYVSTLQENGEWGPAKNLGQQINTPYDDDSPFIHPDGITLFFSTKGHKSIGGFDIHCSVKKDNSWSKPVNLGFPLNTTDDDIYYVITADGKLGYYSSTRDDLNGLGSHDIYEVSPGITGDPPVVAILSGVIFGNDIPIEGTLKLIKQSNNELIGPFSSNSKSGEYLVPISPGEKYVVTVNASGFPEYREELNIADVQDYIKIRKDFHLIKEGYADPHLDTLRSMNDIVNKLLNPVKTDTVTKNPCANQDKLDFSPFKGKSLNDPALYRKLLQMLSLRCGTDIIYRVQIGAYRHPENYNWKHLSQFGVPEKQLLEDGITRFTQGNFTDINKAEEQRQKSISLGQTDAWITALVNGKRYTLEELIASDFLLSGAVPFK